MIKSFKKSFKKLKKYEKKCLDFGLLLFVLLVLILDNPHSSHGIGQVVTGLYILLAGLSFRIGAKPFLKNLFSMRTH